MSTSRQEILDLLGAGKITADEAAELLSKAPSSAPKSPPKPPAPPAKAADPVEIVIEEEEIKKPRRISADNGPSWLHIRVKNLETGQNTVSVNIPLGFVRFGFDMAKRFTRELDEWHWADLSQMVAGDQEGMLVDVHDIESNEQVQIYVD